MQLCRSLNFNLFLPCSDGLGRTGTFCGTFTILERVKAEQVVDVFSTVKSLRIQRPGLLGSLVMCIHNTLEDSAL